MKKKPKLKKYPEGGKKTGFDPITGIHTLAPGEKPYDDAKLVELGLMRFDPNTSRAGQEGEKGWYKVNNPTQTTQQPYLNHAQQMATNPSYAKQYYQTHPNQVPGAIPTFNFGGDFGAGLAGVASGALGTIPLVGGMLQQGVGAIHGALDKDITDQERSIMGYGQAAGALGAGALTGNIPGAIGQASQGISQGINYGFANGGTKYGVPKGVYANGGANAEIEKQELMRMPDGSTDQANGPSHEMGGIPVSIPTGTQIYSDRLKHPETGKTFAKEASKYKIIEAKNGGTLTPTQKLINDVRQKKLDSIFQAQEQLKQDKVTSYAKKMGVTMGTQDPRLTNGIDITTPSSIQDPAKMYAAGGIQPPIEGADEYAPTDFKYDFDPFLKSNQGMNTPFNIGDYSDEIGTAANIVGQNVGNIYDLAQTKFGKKYDKENFGQINPKYLDPTEALRTANMEASSSRQNLKGAVQGNAGAYLANLAGTQSANTLNKANILNQFENQNTSIANQAQQTNLGLKNQARVAEQQNKARSEDIARTAIKGIGTNTAAAIKDYKMGKMDQRSLDIIGKAYPNYEYNPKSRTWEHKTTKEKLKV